MSLPIIPNAILLFMVFLSGIDMPEKHGLDAYFYCVNVSDAYTCACIYIVNESHPYFSLNCCLI